MGCAKHSQQPSDYFRDKAWHADFGTEVRYLADEDPPDVCVIPGELCQHVGITVAGGACAYRKHW